MNKNDIRNCMMYLIYVQSIALKLLNCNIDLEPSLKSSANSFGQLCGGHLASLIYPAAQGGQAGHLVVSSQAASRRCCSSAISTTVTAYLMNAADL